jgi:hypothetical protein
MNLLNRVLSNSLARLKGDALAIEYNTRRA